MCMQTDFASNDQKPRQGSENLAFWLAPLSSMIPLAFIFGLPRSPLFMGTLMAGDPVNPFLWPRLGPWLAAAGVIFDGILLAYLIAVPIYLFFRLTREPMSAKRMTIIFAISGVAVAELVHALQNFRQPGLRAFADSWLSELIGCLCGLVAGACFAFFVKRRFSGISRTILYSLPAALFLICGSILVYVPHLVSK
jgi:hypothetical protein